MITLRIRTTLSILSLIVVASACLASPVIVPGSDLPTPQFDMKNTGMHHA
jgi:hypothetical protein